MPQNKINKSRGRGLTRSLESVKILHNLRADEHGSEDGWTEKTFLGKYILRNAR